ncbi:MAG: hypothetical protein HQK83_19905, partial [Fibrobacteria bacterium]|nr:hypothetical protein [Fibrobacteria bacterium]
MKKLYYLIAVTFLILLHPLQSIAVTISSNGHWLKYKDKNVLLVGESHTQGWQQLGRDFDQYAYIDTLAHFGINVLHLWPFMAKQNQTGDARIGYDSPEIWPWTYSGGKFNLDEFNEDYFLRLDSLISYADKKNIVVMYQFFDGWTKSSSFSTHPFNAALGGPLSANTQFVELANYNAEMEEQYSASWARQQKHQYFL